MLVDFDTRSMDDYRKFLRLKSVPTYAWQGWSANVPDEYAGMLGVNRPSPPTDDYTPSPFLFDYQRAISEMAIRKRKFAVFADCGLGKSLIFLEFARHVARLYPRFNVLIVSPLMVIPQTIAECERWYGETIERVEARNLQDWLNNGTGIGITNYEAIRDDLKPGDMAGLILDESSLLKSHYGKWGTKLIELGRGLEYKLACTGTPAPNDRIEYANHAVLVDHFRTTNEFLARYFVNRGQTDNRWELKPHALRPFYRDLSHWCIFLTNPAVYGWKDNAGTLPPIHVHIDRVPLTNEQYSAATKITGTIFVKDAGGIGQRSKLAQLAKGKGAVSNKPAFIRSLVDSWPDESTIIWCRYNDEQASMERTFPEAASIGGDTPLETRMTLLAWFKGEICTCQKNRLLSGNTCGTTTAKTSTSGPLEPESSETHTTPSGDESMPSVKRSGGRPGRQRSGGRKPIQKCDSHSDSGDTESLHPSIATCSTNKAAVAPSVGRESRAKGDLVPGCTLTTATTLEGFAGCSAQVATSASGSSGTTPPCSSRPLCTCEIGKPQGRIMISKAKCLGFGLNLQIATRQVFSGLQDSYEEFYQAVKRSNRVGSTKPLNVHIPVTEIEEPMIATVMAKAHRVEQDTIEQERLFRELLSNPLTPTGPTQ